MNCKFNQSMPIAIGAAALASLLAVSTAQARSFEEQRAISDGSPYPVTDNAIPRRHVAERGAASDRRASSQFRWFEKQEAESDGTPLPLNAAAPSKQDKAR